MNHQIRILAEQCGFKSNPDIYDRNQSFDIPKFAELIILECIEHLESNVIVPNLEHSRTKTKCIRSIKEHFGLEEQSTEPNGLHTCPYAEEIHGDYETLCDCDEEATRQCAMDV